MRRVLSDYMHSGTAGFCMRHNLMDQRGSPVHVHGSMPRPQFRHPDVEVRFRHQHHHLVARDADFERPSPTGTIESRGPRQS
jgi:hypothetical protein